MSGPYVRVTLLEDSEADAELIADALRRWRGQVDVRRVDSQDGFGAALSDFQPDVVLSDHGMPSFTALDALDILKTSAPETPFIVVTGGADSRWAIKCLRAGADDIVSKGMLQDLGPALDRVFSLRAGLGLLSPRQREVLQLIVRGHTTPQVAEHLGVSVKTVQTHRSELMRRLDIHDISGLVRYAVKVRLIPPDGD